MPVGSLHQLREAAAHLAYASPLANGATASRDRIRSRLTARAAVDVASRELRRTPAGGIAAAPARLTPTRVTPQRPTPPRQQQPAPAPEAERRVFNILAWRRAEWVAAAASVLLVATIGLLAYTMRDRQNIKEALDTQMVFGGEARSYGDSLVKVVAARDSMISGLLGKDVDGDAVDVGRGPRAIRVHVLGQGAQYVDDECAQHAGAAKIGRTYQLWLVTSTAKISAGTFTPKNGDAVVRATYALTGDVLRALAVTEEQSGGAAQPTTAPVIAVSAQ